jgi:hypothetical protein
LDEHPTLPGNGNPHQTRGFKKSQQNRRKLPDKIVKMEKKNPTKYLVGPSGSKSVIYSMLKRSNLSPIEAARMILGK